MTAEAFIKEKLIPELLARKFNFSAPQVVNDAKPYFKATIGGRVSEADYIEKFIEQHRTEWEGK